jgi:Holliday junction resolvase-like predicted endonuclease
MTTDPLSARARAETTDHALEYAREHLERLGYELVEQHLDARTGARLLILASDRRRELLFCELRAERLAQQSGDLGSLRRRRLRRAASAWLTANGEVRAETLRFDRLTVLVAYDGRPIGLEYEPQAF